MSIPKTIHQIHLGSPMNSRTVAMTATFPMHNPGWSHIIWDEAKLATIGIDLQAIKVICGPKFASITNWVRLLVVEKFGGLYFDTDCECIAPLDELLKEEAFVAEQDREGGRARYCNAAFGATAHHGWLRKQIDDVHRFASHDSAWGVYAMTDATHDLRGVSEFLTIVPTAWFYPFKWDTPESERKTSLETKVIHMWEGSWLKK